MLIVVLAGSKFARLADVLGKRLNLGGGWVGLVLLASVTSLPELVTGGTATVIGNVDLAFAAVFGSCCFNVTIIVLLNALIGGGSVLRLASASHRLTSSFGLLLTSIALLGILLSHKFASNPSAAQACELVWAILIVVIYLGSVWLTCRFERSGERESPGEHKRERVGVSLGVPLALMAVILVGASWWLACLGDILSEHPIELIGRPLGATFVGACFLAMATSLPEITTSVVAVRLGNLDMALGNIFGSNMFNIFVLPMLKGVSLLRGEPLLMVPGVFDGMQSVMTGTLAILLTAIAIGGLTYRSNRRMLRRFGLDSILIAITYVCGMCLLLA